MASSGTPAHVRRIESAPASLPTRIIGVIGELLITVAIILGLFAFWQLFWTSYQVSGPAQETVLQFEQEHQAPQKSGERRTDEPPAIDQPAPGEVYGVVHVPKWNWAKIPLAEGTTPDVLAKAYAGHYVETAQPGALGNFSVAGHRRTYGNNFRFIDRLEPGDQVVVETANTYYVYTMDNFEIYSADDETNIKTIAPVPGDLSFSETPTERWMTMTTCHPESSNTERYIVHLKLDSWTPKETGVPAALASEPAK